jgi:nuclear receptor co-repressor 1
VPSSFANASFHAGFPARVSIPQQQQPPTQTQQSVPNAPTHTQLLGSEYITSSNNARAQQQQQQQQQQQNRQNQQTQAAPPPDPGPGGQSQQQQSAQPAYKKMRLNEQYHPAQPPANSLHHPTATPTSIPVRLHHYEKSGGGGSQVVVHVAPPPQQRQIPPPAGTTPEIQYQPKPQLVSAAASPQAPQSATSAGNAKTPIGSVLKIDTRDPPSGYHPKTEAISPAGSPKLSKDDLLQQISSVDSSMMALEERKRILKDKERILIEQKEDGTSVEVPETPSFRHRTLAQQIYAENKKKATENHAILNALNFMGQTSELPLYNQPSDAEVCRKIHEHYLTFRSSLLLHLRKIKSERAQRNQELADKYAKLSADWQKRCEKVESSVKRKAREARNRELFEKVFVELRKQREDKERFNRVGSRVKSEADFEVIVDGLQEQVRLGAFLNGHFLKA